MITETFTILREKIASEPDCFPLTTEPEVGEFLYSLCRMIGAKRVLEVGAWRGFTTLWLAQAVGFDDVWIIDRTDSLSDHFPDEGRKHFIKGESVLELHKLNTLFDLVFLDTDHQYENTMMELEAIQFKLTSGGVVCLHDSVNHHGVTKAVSEVGWAFKVTLKTPAGCGISVLVKKE